MGYPLMKCGHVAQSKIAATGEYACVICFGIDPGATEIADVPDLSQRRAKCTCCDGISPSSMDLAFFEYNPHLEYDSYYCGCRGWE